jgi:hypothetical protein
MRMWKRLHLDSLASAEKRVYYPQRVPSQPVPSAPKNTWTQRPWFRPLLKR